MTYSFRSALVGPILFLTVAATAACTGDDTPCASNSCSDGSTGEDAATPDAGDPPDEPDGGCTGDACPPASCAALDCGAHRLCELTSLGPMCLDDCEEDYELDATTDTCVACAVPGCGPVPTCEVDAPGSIAAQCAAEHRECVAMVASAACGDCADGYHADAETASCVEDVVCTPETCPEGGLCPEQHALGIDDETCSLCDDLSCGLTGEQSVVHDRRDRVNQCICATLPDYYWSFTQRVARRCDEDGDGWVSRSAYAAITEQDDAIREVASASCSYRTVDRVVLENEYGQRKTIFLCHEGLLAEDDPAAASCTAAPLPLVEPDRNDSDVALAAAQHATRVPVFGTGASARRLRANELNALTKGCFSIAADFDGAAGPDIDQAQPPVMPAALLERWASFAYFMELHTSEYVPPAMVGSAGSFVIRERSRCLGEDGASDLPVGYGADDASSGYQRECARQRDARYNVTEVAPGFDFAQWSCDASYGSCDVAEPPIGGVIGADGAILRGACNAGVDYTGTPFRGMHHHSQFKCVLVSGETDREPFEVPLEAIDGESPSADGYLDFQTCATSSDPSAPTFACATDGSPEYGQVGWAAVRYTSTNDYEGADDLPGENPPPLHEVAGCVSEGAWAPSFCPADGPRYENGVLRGYGEATAFGRLRCDCTPEDAAGADVPDAIGWDQNCDGIDGVVSDTVFVATTGNNGSNGSPGSPVQTITRGIQLAQQQGKHHVAVSCGRYEERVSVVNGISLHGDYDAARVWDRVTDCDALIVQEAHHVANGRVETLIASGITTPTVVERFTIVAGSDAVPSGDGTSVYGVRVVSSNADLALRDLTVRAGRAGNGAWRGNGGTGHTTNNTGEDANGWMPGPGGTNEQCSAANGANGGAGSGDPVSWACNTDGVGNGQPGGLPHDGSSWAGHCNVGYGGAGGLACGATRGGQTGGTGFACGNGFTGGAAGAYSGTGNVSSALYSPRLGTDGGSGGPGWGGSGGGGGGCGDAQAFGDGGAGGGGGGGGPGGCGGGGGPGGSGAGGSFGIFLVDSTNVTISASTFQSGRGGNGGAGGQGGTGGTGRPPGSGAGGSGSGGTFPVGAGSGGGGGWGSNGGYGGAGSGGPAGPSIAQFLCRSSAPGLGAGTGIAGSAGNAGPGGHRPNVTIAPNGANATASAHLTRTGNCDL